MPIHVVNCHEKNERRMIYLPLLADALQLRNGRHLSFSLAPEAN